MSFCSEYKFFSERLNGGFLQCFFLFNVILGFAWCLGEGVTLYQAARVHVAGTVDYR